MTVLGPAPRYDLAESFGPDLHLREVLGADDIPLSYGSAAGDPALRAAVAQRHSADAGDVVITTGGMHALFLLAFILCQPGDEAVVTAPLFPLSRTALSAVGARIQTVRLTFEQRYQPNLNDFHAALSARTKLVSVASPQNPSGIAIPRGLLHDLLELMGRVCPQAYLLVDETYREAVYGDASVEISALGLSQKVVSVASLSKCHGAPGLRIGWAITHNAKLREQLIAGKFSTVLCCSAVDEALAIRVLQRDPTRRRRQFASALAQVALWMEANDRLVEWVRPEAGAICCVRLRPTVFDDAAITRFHAELAQRNIRVAAGAWFSDESSVFRLGFGLLPAPDLAAALNGISAALEAAR